MQASLILRLAAEILPYARITKLLRNKATNLYKFQFLRRYIDLIIALKGVN